MILTLEKRMEDINNKTQQLLIYKNLLKSQIESIQSEEKQLRYKSDLYQKCSEMFKLWLEDSLKQNVDSIAELATTGLKHTIFDQNLSFKIKQESKYNRLTMKFLLEENNTEGDPVSSFGGGAAVIISFILRIAVMTRMKMANLLLLDESMVAVANMYVPSAASFMRQLSEQTGINILMVTHNPVFLEHAHVAYEGRKDNSLQLKQLSI